MGYSLNVLIVYAHHEPSSFTSAMKNVAIEVLTHQGHQVVISDLYGQGFNPVAQKWDFVTTTGGHFNYMLEQKHAAKLEMAFSPDILGEIEKIKVADIILFITPIWWFGVPAIMKGWFDRVLAMGVAWDGGKIYQNGLLLGKQAMLIGPAGGPSTYYQEDGKHKATVIQVLHPINHGTLGFCGLNVHEPFISFNSLGMDLAGREKILADLKFRLEHLFDSPQWLIFYG